MATSMTLSQFWQFMEGEFTPAYAHTLYLDFVLEGLGGRTGREAIEAGEDPRRVWEHLCDAMDVPEGRRWGVGPVG